MRSVWLNACDRAERLPWTEQFHELRPPVDNRLWGTSSLATWLTKRDRRTPAGWKARGLMSRLEDALGAGRLVLTAELGGAESDLDPVARYLEPIAPYLDAVNATDNTAAHAHAAAVARALAIKACDEAEIAALCNRLGIPTRVERESSGNRHPVAV